MVKEPSASESLDEGAHLGRVPAWWKWAALVVALVLAILLLVHTGGAERRAIRGLPAPERQALLGRTLQNLKSVCASPDEAMRDFCREQARLALEFQECDHACQALAAPHLSRVQLPQSQ